MNFKQHLIEKATVEEMDIHEKLNDIIDHMNKYATSHEYKITFIKTDRTVTFGCSPSNPRYDVCVPKAIKSEVYRQLFIDRFREMGFDNEDIMLCEGKTNDYNYYNMLLRW